MLYPLPPHVIHEVAYFKYSASADTSWAAAGSAQQHFCFFLYSWSCSQTWIFVTMANTELMHIWLCNMLMWRSLFKETLQYSLNIIKKHCRSVMDAPADVWPEYGCTACTREFAVWFLTQLESSCSSFNIRCHRGCDYIDWHLLLLFKRVCTVSLFVKFNLNKLSITGDLSSVTKSAKPP